MATSAEMSTTTWQELNSTDVYHHKNPVLQRLYSIFIPCILAVIMFSMGCGITFNDVKKHAKKPVAPLIGLLSQFIIMPAAAFGLAHALKLADHHAIGMVIVGSCPGGSVSNIFTYWSRGDLSLSICMTLLSTVLALGFMPLNMFIYLRSWTDSKATIPFITIVLGILVTWLPVAGGLFVQYKSKKVAKYLVKAGSVAGMTMIAVAGIVQSRLYPEYFSLPLNIWLAASSLPIVGFVLGFLMGSVACLPVVMCRTIGFETGLQNVALALSLITLSFPGQYGNMLSQFPLMFGGGQMCAGFFITFAHNIYFCIHDRKCKPSCAEVTKEIDQETSSDQLYHKRYDNKARFSVVEIVQVETSFDAKPQTRTVTG